MSNICGKCYSFNVIAPIRPWKTVVLRFCALVARFAATLIIARGGAEGLGRMAQLPIVNGLLQLLKLSFVHKARFVLLDTRAFGRAEGREGPRARLRNNYLLFLSNFTTTWDAYIDDIAAVVPSIFDWIWGFTEGYDRSGPFDEFKAYIRRNQLDTDYYFAAYQQSSATDVLKALHLACAVREFANRNAGAWATGTLAEFEASFARLRETVQGDLATTPPPDAHVHGDGPEPLGNAGSRGVAALFPLRPHKLGEPAEQEQLRAFLAAQQNAPQSPLATVGGIHFARFAVIDELFHEGRAFRRDRLAGAYLVYVCDFDGHLDDHAQALFDRAHPFVASVWKHCRGLAPGFDRSAFRAYLQRCRLPVLFQVESAPGAGVGAIQEALALQRRFIDFLVRTQGKPPSEVRGAFSALARDVARRRGR
jgi:hypothetical protein